MSDNIVQRALGLICVLVLGLCVSVAAAAKEATPKGSHSSSGNAIIFARVMKDGEHCVGTIRLRPLRGRQIDMGRFVDIGQVDMTTSKPQLEAMGEFFLKGLTFDISGLMAEMKTELKDWLVPIAPGSYVMTSIRCRQGNRVSTMGSDRSNLFAAETGEAYPIRGANIIDVRPGEILHAGVLEIRSDDVGFFETKTATIVASSAPEHDQIALREMFAKAGKKLRFATFRTGKQ